MQRRKHDKEYYTDFMMDLHNEIDYVQCYKEKLKDIDGFGFSDNITQIKDMIEKLNINDSKLIAVDGNTIEGNYYVLLIKQ